MREEATKGEETLSDMRGTQQRPPPCRQPLPNPPGLTLQLRPADELNLIEFFVVTIQEDNKILNLKSRLANRKRSTRLDSVYSKRTAGTEMGKKKKHF